MRQRTRLPGVTTAHSRLFTVPTLLLTLACLALNIALAKLTLWLGLPVFLDSVGTVLAAALGGGLPGVAVGFLTNVINSVGDPITLYYGTVSVLIALLAAGMSRRGWLRKPVGALAAAFVFAAVGGGLGSVLTWLLYGMNIGEGISSELAASLHATLPMGAFASQLTADVGIDILDKLITMLIVFPVLRFLPQKLCAVLPYGELYAHGERRRLPERGEQVRISLRGKIAAILIVSSFVLGATAVLIGYAVYKEDSDARYKQTAISAAATVAETLDGDDIVRYATTGETDEKYFETEEKLYRVKAAFPDVRYLYVLQVHPDESRVIFDLDAPDLAGSKLGEKWENEPAFLPQLDALMLGDPIEPVISKGAYGWLLTAYVPVYDSMQTCAGYAAVDISMEQVRADRYEYAIRIIALLFGASIVLVAAAMWFSEQRIVAPIKAITTEASRFAYGTADGDKPAFVQNIKLTDFHTGDEIEELATALSKTAGDVTDYITEIEAQSTLITRLQNNIIRSIADMVENRDENTGHHIRRTAAYVNTLAAQLRADGVFTDLLDDRYCEDLDKSAPLHDIGKIKIPDSILQKPGKLTHDEFETMKTHTTCGRDIIRNVLKGIEGDSYLHLASDMALYHHEKWDGSGYPTGIAGEDIPVCARLMAIADVFDALVSESPYKQPIPFDDAVVIITDGAGRHFDPVMVQAFLHAKDKIRRIAESNTDETEQP